MTEVSGSQSAYSRWESGETPMTVPQLKAVAGILRTTASHLLLEAESYEQQLVHQGVKVVIERPSNEAGAAIGLGILAALLFAAKKS